MPTYLYSCKDHGEFEEYHSMSITLSDCPKCISDGKTGDDIQKITRLINCSSKGVVELSGHELTAKIKEDTAQLKKDIYSSEKTYANVLGESKYEVAQKRIDEGKKIFRRK